MCNSAIRHCARVSICCVRKHFVESQRSRTASKGRSAEIRTTGRGSVRGGAAIHLEARPEGVSARVLSKNERGVLLETHELGIHDLVRLLVLEDAILPMARK